MPVLHVIVEIWAEVKRVWQVLTRHLRLAEEVDFAAVAARTPGFVGADLAALAKEAAALAVRRIFARLEAVRSQAFDVLRVPVQAAV